MDAQVDEIAQHDVDVEKKPAKDKNPSMLFSMRFFMALMGFGMLAVQSMQRVNTSVAIVCMVNNTALKAQYQNSIHGLHVDSNHSTQLPQMYSAIREPSSSLINETSPDNEFDCKSSSFISRFKTHQDGPFVWSKLIQGLILSSVYIGNVFTQVFGAWLAMRYGFKKVITISMLTDSILTGLSPLAANLHYSALIAFRLVIGMAHGVEMAAITSVIPVWIPPNERSTILAVTSIGTQIGIVITLPVGGLLCVYGFGGWISIFVLIGILGIIWTILWLIFSSDKPEQNRFIKEKEKIFILKAIAENSSPTEKKKLKVPWKKILTSKAVYSLIIAQSCCNFGSYVFSTQLPSYMREILKMDIKSVSMLSSLPYWVYLVFCVLSGIISDKIIKSGCMRRIVARKLFNTLGFIIPMIMVLFLMFVNCQRAYIGVILITIGLGFSGLLMGAGFFINIFDISGPYSPIIYSIANTVGMIFGIIAPFMTGVITRHQRLEEWRILFIVISVIYMIGALSFLVLGSGETLPWATNQSSDPKENENLNEQELKLLSEKEKNQNDK